jgi:transposase
MRYDLTDFEWSVIEPLLPKDRRGVKPQSNRRILNNIFWVLRAGAPWRDLPNDTGPILRPTRGRCTRDQSSRGQGISRVQ